MYALNKTAEQKVIDRLQERNPDLLAEIIDEIEAEENQRRHKKEVNPYIDTDYLGNCFSDADPGL